ncbi:MAG: transketolase, partial [Acetobacter sp.]|nr:transketolase [Acetobacter sp.]
IGAYEALMSENIPARVVSMPSWELFEAQSAEYRNNVLPPSVSGRVVVEAASALGWERYAGDKGEIIALPEFGASAPGAQLFQHFGLTQEAVLAAARKQARQ